MRFNILLSITFFATFAAGLVIPTNGPLEFRDLEVREGVVDDLSDGMVFKREPRSSGAKKARIAAAASEKVAAKAARKKSFEHAAKAQKGTTNLPNRHSTFHVAAAPGTELEKPAHSYTGKEVRKAIFDSHMEAHRIKGITKNQRKKSPLKSFNNRPHEVPKPHGGARPLKHMNVVHGSAHHPPGREFPLPNKHDAAKPSPARVIIQQTKGGHYTFRGVVSHDQSRTPGPGYNDHFQVKPRRH
ncbi:hypothetical protein BDN70DRAFT_924647 [Pholiota conissans]|uniref:Uncharacterized protein n=1 Tax=Pholiota conissans TaxID=109636 RepID=A0A9P5YR55_9AGAR|nr:hypothetical protein BDN70DRAFT_924647 [Pholiota conissans]